jgi:hypothetical protein
MNHERHEVERRTSFGNPAMATPGIRTPIPGVDHGTNAICWSYLLGLTFRAPFARIGAPGGMVHELVELVMVNGTVK